MTTNPILLFRGEYRFLSNFYIEPDDSHVEGEYQASKCDSQHDYKWIIGPPMLPPGEAKRAGRRITIREDWDKCKRDIMWELVRKKFVDHPKLSEQLIATGSRRLVEGNNWGDEYWGVTNNGLGSGSNHLGKILMEVRHDLAH